MLLSLHLLVPLSEFPALFDLIVDGEVDWDLSHEIVALSDGLEHLQDVVKLLDVSLAHSVSEHCLALRTFGVTGANLLTGDVSGQALMTVAVPARQKLRITVDILADRASHFLTNFKVSIHG